MAEGYIYRSQGKQHGPVSGAELRQLAANGTLQPTDLVAKAGTDKWVAAMAVDGLIPRAAPAAAAPLTAPPAPSTAELLQRDLQNIKGLADKILPSKRTRDLLMSRYAVLFTSFMAFSLAAINFDGPSYGLIGFMKQMMILWNLIILGLLGAGTFAKKRAFLTTGCKMAFGSWLFLLVSHAPLIVTLTGTLVSGAAAYWALTVLNREDVKEYYASLNAQPGMTKP